MTLLIAILLVDVLVTVHELGHFTVAKLLDVKVLRLSLGFGPRLLTLRRGDTEYALSAIPLGGYVKLLGEDPRDEISVADQDRSFPSRPAWQRLAIVFAGPAANLIFPFLLYLQFFAGQSRALSATVGVVLDDQPASGVLQPGDRIVAIDDETVRYWDDVQRLVQSAPGRDLRITVERPGEERPLTKVVTPRLHEERDPLGQRLRVGLLGVEPYYRLAQIGVRPGSAAERASLRTFDLITSVQGRPVHTYPDLEVALQRHRGEALVVTYLRPREHSLGFTSLDLLDSGLAQIVPDVVPGPAGRPRYEDGIRPGELFVRRIEPGSPAAAAGMRAGDELTRLDGAALSHWELLDRAFTEQPERAFRIGWRDSAGLDREATLHLAPRAHHDELSADASPWVFGAEPTRAIRPVAEVPIEARGPWAVRRALGLTVEITAMMVRVILSGRTQIGGPIMVYHLASVAAAHGADQLLAVAALVSLNLGLFNLLPVPVLDGGHLLFLVIEAVRRKPIGHRARERAARLGLAFLGLLTLFATRNDILRYWLHR